MCMYNVQFTLYMCSLRKRIHISFPNRNNINLRLSFIVHMGESSCKNLSFKSLIIFKLKEYYVLFIKKKNTFCVIFASNLLILRQIKHFVKLLLIQECVCVHEMVSSNTPAVHYMYRYNKLYRTHSALYIF